MEKALRDLLGFKVAEPFKKIEKVGDLLYFDGPLTSVYKDEENRPYIYDWVESNNEVNRWLLYQIEEYLLSDYINEKVSHLHLLQSPVNDIIFVLDIDSQKEVRQCLVVAPKNIPNEYLPQGDSMFDEEDSRNVGRIINTFNLKKVSRKQNTREFDILCEAKKYNTELINLHFKSQNKKVGFGKIYTSVLGDLLSSFHELSEATAINLFDERGHKDPEEKGKRKRGELNRIKELGETEFYYSKAASFSVFLKPAVRNINLFTQETSSEQIQKRIFDLFKSSVEIKSLQKLGGVLSKEVLSAYNVFLKHIKENDITLTVQYANPEKEFSIDDYFDVKKSNIILSNLDILEFQEMEQVQVIGNFKALDSISNSFKFEDIEGNSYMGKFSKQLQQGIPTFNLRNLYSVNIDILKEKKSGQIEAKEKNTIVACINLD